MAENFDGYGMYKTDCLPVANVDKSAADAEAIRKAIANWESEGGSANITDPYRCCCDCHQKLTGEEALRCGCCTICQYCGFRIKWGKYSQHLNQFCFSVKLV